jgi:hypothetical protein
MTATSARITLSPAAALARHDHRYWNDLYRRHLESAPRTRCACATGGLCALAERFSKNADAAGWRYSEATGNWQ